MYQVIKNGVLMGLIEHPVYIELLDNGSYGLCDKARARGITYEGQVYALGGKPGIEGTETVILVQVDTGTVLNDAAGKISEIEDAMCEQDTAAYKQRAEIEDALCELDKNG